MSEVKFDLKPVMKKPSRKYRKGSKYDPILDAFLESVEDLVEVEVEGKSANSLFNKLNTRIKAMNLAGKISVSLIDDVLYLERIQRVSKESLRIRDRIEIEQIQKSIRPP